ncbi:MAG: hypothetical protein K8R21_03805, partial [Leptospira sp.]|nr:hypothetical protein [Leptospira sp.]
MRLIILFSLLIASTGFSAKETSMADFSRFLISASVYYEVFSHSNPERKPNTAHETVELIQFAKGEFLGAIKKQTYPLFAEIP